MYYFRDPFPNHIRGKWLESAVVTRPRTFTSLPPDLNVDLPPSPWPWLYDSAENLIVMAKKKPPPSRVANEKIVSDFGSLFDLPVLPGKIWQTRNWCYFISPLAFQNSLELLSPDMLEADPYLPAMAIFDLWIRNTDREAANIIWDGSSLSFQGELIYIDHESSLNGNIGFREGERGKLLDFEEDFFGEKWFWANGSCIKRIKASALDKIPASPLAQNLMSQIERLPLTTIQEIVFRIPDDYFSEGKEEKSLITNGLYARASRIREMVDIGITRIKKGREASVHRKHGF